VEFGSATPQLAGGSQANPCRGEDEGCAAAADADRDEPAKRHLMVAANLTVTYLRASVLSRRSSRHWKPEAKNRGVPKNRTRRAALGRPFSATPGFLAAAPAFAQTAGGPSARGTGNFVAGKPEGNGDFVAGKPEKRGEQQLVQALSSAASAVP
jgi:hypothetical protein